MQSLLAPPRELLSTTAVTNLLTSTTLEVQPGLEYRESDIPRADDSLPPWIDISSALVGGRIRRDNYADKAHGTCTLALTRKLEWGKVQVRPYVIFRDGLTTARFNLGVYVLTTPAVSVGGEIIDLSDTDENNDVQVYEVTGYDLRYKLDRPVGDNFEVPPGTPFKAAVERALDLAGIPGRFNMDNTGTVPEPGKSWLLLPQEGGDINTTWLQIIDDLLAACNYTPLWFDENGNPQSKPEVDAASQPVDWTFNADDPRTTLVGQERQSEADTWNVPNGWIFIAKAQLLSTGDSVVVDTTANKTKTSFENLGYRRWKIRESEAMTIDTLNAEAARFIAEDLRVAHTIQITTGPFPLAGHRDRYDYIDQAISPFTMKVRARDWSFDMLGGDMSHTFEVISS